MNVRASAFLVTMVAALAGCSSENKVEDSPPPADPAAYTVSYRNQVRLPHDGEILAADAFATQIKARDPIGGTRCGAEESPAFKDLTTFLGGIGWSHPVSILKDASLPPLYDGRFTPQPPSAEASAGASDAGAAPTIERPDLVGVNNGIAVFLSKQHGLLAVNVRGAAPVVSCSMKLPGEPKNFLFHDGELVVVVNARSGTNRSALLRYSFDGAKFHFVDSVRFDNQIIEDARLFDSTIVAYTSWFKPQPPAATPPATGNGGGASAGTATGSVASPIPGYYDPSSHLGSKVLVVNWDKELGVDWEDSLLDDKPKQDPTEGSAPKKYTAGELVSETKSYKSFVAASDRYVVVPRDVQQTRFSHYETYSYQVCTSYNPQYEQIQVCSVNYERRDNPDYRAPDPATGDYSCNGQKLADCIQQAAPVVSQYVYVPTGQTCNMVWQGRCEKYETRTETYPRFDTTKATELSIYRFEAGSFSRLDSSLAKMVEKAGAISFEKSPLSLTGAISNRNQIQFQNGHLYVFADAALQTMSVAGNSIAFLNKLGVEANTENNPSIVFSTDRAMISSSTYSGSYPASQVTMLDLTTPSLPKPLNAFSMPGQSTQLILANGGILGPGQVGFGNAQVSRNLQKLTLFSNQGGQELDNLLLGTEYDTFETSWLDATDDQRIRLGAGGSRLFLPYSGRHHADQYEPTAHRLNISRIENNRLVSERSFSVSDDIIRTAPLDDTHSLVFANSASYMVDRTSGDWAISTLQELFVPFATYRLNDGDLHARISRVGSKCLVSTQPSTANIFDKARIADREVPCGDNAYPIGFGSNVLFPETRTGVSISADGTAIELLQPADVAAMLEKANAQRGYCYIPSDGSKNGSPLEFLDAVPSQILCVSQQQLEQEQQNANKLTP